jgi:regulator of protease activity HflC (stomatin/prohibitin superfamily)
MSGAQLCGLRAPAAVCADRGDSTGCDTEDGIDVRSARKQYTNIAMWNQDATGQALSRGARVTVRQWEKGLLFRHGRLETVLEPGSHRRWGSGFTLRPVDLRPWIVALPPQEIPTADGVTLKVTVAGRARITDPSTYVTAARDVEQALYLAVQVALRELVSATTVDDLLTGRPQTGVRLLEGVRGIDELGITLEQLEIKDVILPTEIKRAQAAVLVARAQGTASLERARGETAALRSLANSARLVADNPALLQLRLLQQLEASTGHTVVIGNAPMATASTPSASSTSPATGG